MKKHFLFFFLFLLKIATLAAQSDCYQRFVQAGDKSLKIKNFDDARNQYNAALECPSLASEQRTAVAERLKKVDKEINRDDREARQKAEQDKQTAVEIARELAQAKAKTDSLLVLAKINEQRATGNELGFKAQVELRDGDRTAAFRLAEFIEKYTDPGNSKATEALLAATYFNNDQRNYDRLGWRIHTLVEQSKFATTQVAFSSDGEKFGSLAENGVAQIWDLASGRSIFSHQISGFAYVARFSPALDLLAVSNLGKLEVVSTATGKVIFEKIFPKTGIETFKFSSDGRRIALVLVDKSIEILGLTDGSDASPLLRVKRDSLRYAIHFSDDLQHLAVASCEEKLKIYSAQTDAFVAPGETGGYIFAVAFSPDGKHLACSTEDRELLLFNSTTGALVSRITTLRDVAVAARSREGTVREAEILSTGSPFKLQFSTDGSHLTAFFADRTALVFAVSDEAGLFLKNFFKTNFDYIFDTEASANAKFLMFSDGRRLEILTKIAVDPAQPTSPNAAAEQYFSNTFEGKYQPPYTFSPLGNRFAVGLTDGRVAVADLAQSFEIQLNINGAPDAQLLAFSPDDQFLAVVRKNGAVEIWDAQGRETPLSPAPLAGRLFDARFSPDRQHVALLDEAGFLSLLRLADDSILFQKRVALPLAPKHKITEKPLLHFDASRLRVSFSPDGRRLMLRGRSLSPLQRDTIFLLKTADGKPDFEVFSAGFVAASFTGGGRFLKIRSDFSENLFDAATGAEVKFLQKNCFTADVSDDGRWAVFKTSEGIFVAETADGRIVFTLKPELMQQQYAQKSAPTSQNFYPLAFSPDGSKLLVQADFGLAKIFNTADWRLLGNISHGGNERLEFSPDGRRVASLSYSYFSIWDAEDGRLLTALPAGGRRPIISQNSEWLAVVQGTQIVIYDFELAQERLTLRGHRDNVVEMAFAADGEMLATADADNIIKCWNLTTGREIFTLSAGETAVRTLEYSPDGQFLLANNGSSEAMIWTIAPQKLIEMAQRSGRIAPLNEDQIYRFNLEQTFLEMKIEDALPGMEPSTQLGFARYFAAQAGISLDPKVYGLLFARSEMFYKRAISNLDNSVALAELGEVLVRWAVKLRKDSLFGDSREVASKARQIFKGVRSNEVAVLVQKGYAAALAVLPDEATRFFLEAIEADRQEQNNIHLLVDFLATAGDDRPFWENFWTDFQRKIPQPDARIELGSGMSFESPPDMLFNEGEYEKAAEGAVLALVSGLSDLHSQPRPLQAQFVASLFSNLSWYFLFTKRGAKTARQYAQAAMAIDSTVLFANVNLGHAALLDGDFDGAMRIYDRWKSVLYIPDDGSKERYLEDEILKDLEKIAETGRRFWNRDVPRVAERILGLERWDEVQARRFNLKKEEKEAEKSAVQQQGKGEEPPPKKRSKKGKN